MTLLKKKTNQPKRNLNDLLKGKSVLTGREVVQRIKDKEKLRKQFEEAVEFERRNGRRSKDQKGLEASMITS